MTPLEHLKWLANHINTPGRSEEDRVRVVDALRAISRALDTMVWRHAEYSDPHDGERCLVTVLHTELLCDKDPQEYIAVEVADWHPHDWYDDDGMAVHGVTHWMPLPDPPEGET